MKLTLLNACTAFLLSSALAAPNPRPSPAFDRERAAARIRKFKENGFHKNSSLTVRDTVEQNWGGAQLSVSGGQSVQATINVPSVKWQPGADSNTEYFGCAWIGLDGYGCDNLWQGGAYWEGPGNGAVRYFSFYEWYPADPVFTELTVNPGDNLAVAFSADSPTSGSFTITDTATGQSASQSLTGQPPLCSTSVEWIVEDNLTYETVPDFGTITFSDASYTANGATGTVDGANIIDMNNNGVTWTSCTAGGNTVTCQWQDQ